MKSKVTLALLGAALLSLSPVDSLRATPAGQEVIEISLDLVNVKDDKVQVTVTAPAITAASIKYRLPKTIPGTYSIENYGKYVVEFKATDDKGAELEVVKQDVNTWEIKDATKLRTITYLVNDTYDTEVGGPGGPSAVGIFSPAGTNILEGKNFVLNLPGFAGYFENMMNTPYELTVNHPETLYGGTAMIDADPAKGKDLFKAKRYADLIDCPIMYSEPDYTEFRVGETTVLLAVYSPKNKKLTAKSLSTDLQKIIKGQKNFLGSINNTKRYAVLVYITSASKGDAQGIGALEHNTSTLGTFMENMGTSDLNHVIGHEFFHTVTPLNIHSREIHDFNYDTPNMSKHLWLYEGCTEYFAHLFQVNQGLITETKFMDAIREKVNNASYMNDTLSFTRMSKNILQEQMKAQFANVYMKGALMAMCMDIIIREKSQGNRGLLDVIGELAKKYGPDKPFEDNDFIAEFTAMTNPEVGEFINKYITKGGSVDYAEYLERVGVTESKVTVPEQLAFVIGQKPYIGFDTASKKTYAVMHDDKNRFMNAFNLKTGDILLEMDGKKLEGTIMEILMMGYNLKEGTPMTMKIEREGKEMKIDAKVALTYTLAEGYKFTDQSKAALKNAWLKN